MKYQGFLVVAVGLAGCGVSDRLGLSRDLTAAALPYEATIAISEDKRDMVIAVTAPAGAGVDAVRESVRYQATRHCLSSFGYSDANWQIDPATGDWAFSRAEDTMTFSARCVGHQ